MLIVTFVLCQILRRLVRPFLKGDGRLIFGEFMAIFQLSCCIQELNFTDHQFSLPIRMLRLFSVILATCYFFDGCTGHVGWISEIVILDGRFFFYLLLLIAQLCGGYAAYLFTPYYFPHHYFQHFYQDRPCQSLDPIQRAWIEFIGTSLLFLLDWCTRRYEDFNRVSQTLYVVAITYLYYGHIDVFINPIMAKTMTAHCNTEDLNLHLLIYWIGPIISIVLPLIVIRFMSRRTEVKVKED
ncbi:hypothetical protein TrispH2_004813 [Trichoplax sp. H2]|nr:hypothetical protein TrispH2_004813 [Trichoplax sp. H2]|eukprot:RDD42786.1 hypothetical protein TrispH2_004813 [Trichoplax sp. H2]